MINFAPCILFAASIACISVESSMKQKLFEESLRTTVQLEEAPSTKFSIMERMDHYRVPAASVAVIDNGKLEWAKGYGFADERHTRAVDEHTLFQAGSISKSLTAFGALLLVEQGKLSLDRDVNTYLSRWKVQENALTKKSKVTLRRLLSHTAGTSVSGFPGYAEGSTLPSLIDVLNGNKPYANTDAVTVTEEPGSRHQYSGGGTTIVQLLIEEVTKEPFEKWMKSNVLLPLGMRESTFAHPIPKELKDKTLSGYHRGGIPIEGERHAYPEMGAAGLWTTPADLAQFILYIQQALEGKRTDLLSEETVREMLTRQRTSDGTVIESGLGVFLDVDGCALRFGHKGQNEGFIAELTSYGLWEKELSSW